MNTPSTSGAQPSSTPSRSPADTFLTGRLTAITVSLELDGGTSDAVVVMIDQSAAREEIRSLLAKVVYIPCKRGFDVKRHGAEFRARGLPAEPLEPAEAGS